MISALNNALSGLSAAEKRLNVAANNIANQASTARTENGITVNEPFRRQQVQQVSQEEGGVRTLVKEDPLTVPSFQPDNPAADANGVVQTPNVSLEQEVVNTITATYDAKANLQVIKQADKQLKNLLDILA